MSLLKTVNESEATGVAQQIYEGFTQILGRVPNVVKLHSASEIVFPRIMDLINQFAAHPTLDPIFVSYMRLLVSHKYGGEYCVKFQTALLKMRGESEEKIANAKENPENVHFEEKRKALLLFVLDFIDMKCENVEDKLENLRSLGWNDNEIYEFCFLGGLQKGMVPIIKGFKVEHDY